MRTAVGSPSTAWMARAHINGDIAWLLPQLSQVSSWWSKDFGTLAPSAPNQSVDQGKEQYKTVQRETIMIILDNDPRFHSGAAVQCRIWTPSS